MDVPIKADLEQYIQEKVRSGEYASAAHVVEEGLRLLRELEKDEISGEELNRLIAEGQADLDSGNVVDAEEVFAEIRRKSEQMRGKVG